jgi:hypothetical protein
MTTEYFCTDQSVGFNGSVIDWHVERVIFPELSDTLNLSRVWKGLLGQPKLHFCHRNYRKCYSGSRGLERLEFGQNRTPAGSFGLWQNRVQNNIRVKQIDLHSALSIPVH